MGIGRALLEQGAERLMRVPTTDVCTIAPGVHLVPHNTPGLAEQGLGAGMLLRSGDGWQGDDFAHEMSLVFELDERVRTLAIFSSCSHAGLPTIAREVSEAFPSWRIGAFVGGLHLVHASDAEIEQVAQAARDFGIERLCTGHCTGAHATHMLESLLPDQVEPLRPGLILSFE
jgi:7,8-dihydropterin-6-yl-methyl-4-(beta-D-ribofuranosyl)aminobenzene 5'-phosphate synthase